MNTFSDSTKLFMQKKKKNSSKRTGFTVNDRDPAVNKNVKPIHIIGFVLKLLHKLFM